MRFSAATGPELTEHRVVEALVAQAQPQGVLPCQPVGHPPRPPRDQASRPVTSPGGAAG